MDSYPTNHINVQIKMNFQSFHPSTAIYEDSYDMGFVKPAPVLSCNLDRLSELCNNTLLTYVAKTCQQYLRSVKTLLLTMKSDNFHLNLKVFVVRYTKSSSTIPNNPNDLVTKPV